MNASSHLQEKFQMFLNQYSSESNDNGEARVYSPPDREGHADNYGIQFPGYHIQNMMDVVIEHLQEMQDYHRFLIIELRNSKHEFSLKYKQMGDIASGYCHFCNKLAILRWISSESDPHATTYCSQQCREHDIPKQPMDAGRAPS